MLSREPETVDVGLEEMVVVCVVDTAVLSPALNAPSKYALSA